MRIHHLQHVPFETLGSMEPLLLEMGHTLSASHLYHGDALPALDAFDGLIVMGGPMGIYDDADYPWLPAERAFIKAAIDGGKTVLGVCLGAQLIADALGAKVYPGAHREIGWHTLRRAPEMDDHPFADVFPQELLAFHWHRDTFPIPDGALPLAASDACPNQGFLYNDTVLALQFHLETTPESAAALIEHCSDELDGTAYVQSAEEIMEKEERFEVINRVMRGVLGMFFIF